METLMEVAENKYKTMTQDDSWNALSPEEEKIVALSTKLNKVEKDNLALSKKLKSQKGRGMNQDGGSSKKKEKGNDGGANDCERAIDFQPTGSR